ncbi:LLM class F420-dependent oxidoreductase [Protaetiibacter mangrovi]|uniref:LLM class F420-dependent oxidoreductase n=1 Tax=Protaetiibacter mangrovi TaxID=2970926 RepID=A0ABT1ZC62_9MICO|nr:LLM class F420-dependent oxidoreductase [Protaetiibacter mangrovi]MCS0498297.1 LLM class F420-dependent oxidoreductase [Protaetiibacter mangrovi]TPX05598.1 LLM class F420-dependent oxidoreductase [Schumannella luteola]
MRFGLHFMDFTLPGAPASIAATIARTARATEDAGGSWFTAMDHYFQMERFRTAHDEMLEGYTVLGFAAAHTSRVRLGTLVTGVTYRHPGLLAKIATTLDVLSEGRAILGVGAAWYEREHQALGVPYPPLAERFERLEETLRIALQMWDPAEVGPFDGAHYHLAETICVPAPLSSPHPPIMIGGNGEQKTLRMVAQYADIANFTVNDPDEVAHKLEVLRAHCDRLGRDYAAIEKTVQGGQLDPLGDPDGFLRRMEQLAALGVEHVQLRNVAPDPAGFIAEFGERVAPRLAELQPAGR